MQRKSIEIWVGVFMLVGIAAIVMLAVQVSAAGTGANKSYRLEARFDNIGGLNVKAPVMIGGVRVGRVGGIWIDKEDYVAVVGLDIDQQYDTLAVDTGASILTSGLLGAQFVGLSPGFSDIYLEQGDTLELTQSAIQLESLISQFMFSQGQDQAKNPEKNPAKNNAKEQ
ncbi:outer membrane lipid asymmetry maintenance protein MlaD [Candidatus Spongiihabitans sp.]|uniref:outer membrane lipid asymmetry maintenance protein MlaD n=1 Tax=Candidatus Spongiihabitans sp. TaxID=3101308 RepID=UPI003C6FBA8B